ncbi:MAG: methionine--tRNA ligase [Candidatus Kerfeldbacteria bacterium RIFOXYA2_FULL_38_24]|uniref:Methionine--tRNA ligase n=1 Tax=Candidatus Kerfeldbacteria bacterium RIFOXYB2_FULL_38_14 TaxID=1798547 RepID=A0A1G2BA12_9BACT|nr:MAG: methionine--tRNA ligase [Candidatus Kerfeldbacteria bacterium RIFOXYA2_FULL_38_24]OGY86001.1 MAG: methionine--tRNA ligase [Candidatus Kerfeldbacteria bacterium RIFOXYB2_FULL_38_14]OGY90113.1 MAG: methionine--tRNA ligase [Candidatus Kerfeldbacteria bacterium RIFOXYC2_FULL_38_9]
MKENTFYITTTLPYVNAQPHLGHAMEFLRADVLARFETDRKKQVFFNTGTDEHGQKIYQKAQAEQMSVQSYCDQQAENFKKLKPQLNLSFNSFIRTTDEHHVKAAQEFWKRCEQNGSIYKKNYKQKYCVGCELEKTDSELIDGKCPEHHNQALEIREEENYFFKFSAWQEKLLLFYEKNPDFVAPQKRFKEIKNFVAQGLADFSISRLKEKMPWGVDVPGDPQHVMYVWFDALINYISCLGWPQDLEKFSKFWPGVQICGKDNLRQQTAMWQAMLMAADLPNSQKVFVNGHIGVNGQKMSKSLGNVIAPKEMVTRYGLDATRYLLLAMGNFGEDFDISWEKMDIKYTADLANGLGNLLSRTTNMIEKYFKGKLPASLEKPEDWKKINTEFVTAMENMESSKALTIIWALIGECNEYIEKNKPWDLAKTNQAQLVIVLQRLLSSLKFCTLKLAPFMPATAQKMTEALDGDIIYKIEPLFPRLEK